MKLITLHEAEIEFGESITHYESKEPGLGIRLRDEAEAVVNWIGNNPEVPRLRPKGYRRVNFPVFQHYIAYILRGDVIWIVAIAHAHRLPEYWLERLGG
jgi:hypothetical protein